MTQYPTGTLYQIWNGDSLSTLRAEHLDAASRRAKKNVAEYAEEGDILRVEAGRAPAKWFRRYERRAGRWRLIGHGEPE